MKTDETLHVYQAVPLQITGKALPSLRPSNALGPPPGYEEYYPKGAYLGSDSGRKAYRKIAVERDEEEKAQLEAFVEEYKREKCEFSWGKEGAVAKATCAAYAFDRGITAIRAGRQWSPVVARSPARAQEFLL